MSDPVDSDSEDEENNVDMNGVNNATNNTPILNEVPAIDDDNKEVLPKIPKSITQKLLKEIVIPGLFENFSLSDLSGNKIISTTFIADEDNVNAVKDLLEKALGNESRDIVKAGNLQIVVREYFRKVSRDDAAIVADSKITTAKGQHTKQRKTELETQRSLKAAQERTLNEKNSRLKEEAQIAVIDVKEWTNKIRKAEMTGDLKDFEENEKKNKCISDSILLLSELSEPSEVSSCVNVKAELSEKLKLISKECISNEDCIKFLRTFKAEGNVPADIVLETNEKGKKRTAGNIAGSEDRHSGEKNSDIEYKGSVGHIRANLNTGKNNLSKKLNELDVLLNTIRIKLGDKALPKQLSREEATSLASQYHPPETEIEEELEREEEHSASSNSSSSSSSNGVDGSNRSSNGSSSSSSSNNSNGNSGSSSSSTNNSNSLDKQIEIAASNLNQLLSQRREERNNKFQGKGLSLPIKAISVTVLLPCTYDTPVTYMGTGVANNKQDSILLGSIIQSMFLDGRIFTKETNNNNKSTVNTLKERYFMPTTLYNQLKVLKKKRKTKVCSNSNNNSDSDNDHDNNDNGNDNNNTNNNNNNSNCQKITNENENTNTNENENTEVDDTVASRRAYLSTATPSLPLPFKPSSSSSSSSSFHSEQNPPKRPIQSETKKTKPSTKKYKQNLTTNNNNNNATKKSTKTDGRKVTQNAMPLLASASNKKATKAKLALPLPPSSSSSNDNSNSLGEVVI